MVQGGIKTFPQQNCLINWKPEENASRNLRKKDKLSQREIAEKLNIVQQTYAGYENGHHEPSLDLLIQIADFHKVTLDYISGRVFDDWLPAPFTNMKENGQSQNGGLSEIMERPP
jgi:transcriptional regulator with XRE-family HTH domain